MEISMEELDVLTESRASAQVRIKELEGRLMERDAELERLRTENVRLRDANSSLNIENTYLRNVIILSVERIREFMKRVTSIERWSFLRTFILWSLPEKGRQEQQELVDSMMGLPKEESGTQIVIGNAEDVIAEGGVKNVGKLD